MFKSLLNALSVSVDSLILDIFIILGVVIAGALVVYFLWELVSSLVAKSKKGSTIKEPNFGEKKKSSKENKNEETSLVVDYSLDEENEDVAVDVVEGTQEQELFDESEMTDVNETVAEEEKADLESQASEEERLNAERRAYLEARRQELIKRMQEEVSEEKEESENEEIEEQDETVESEEVEEETEDVDALADERQALASEKARYETMVKELEAAKRALAEQKHETVYETVVTNGVLSLEELKAKLADAEERLRTTEKEFKQCKKEYTPLRRVWVAHEKDERKLRRKEALVARQKVLLYGVNNYADIDEEKAKKLAEDLDHLDGLKLSVQHCEEVMKKNEERYPLLERMYNVLSARNEELKNDIAYYKQEIAKLEAEDEE